MSQALTVVRCEMAHTDYPAWGTGVRRIRVSKASIAHVVDEGEWFDPGTHVEYARPSPRRSERRLEKAVLGAYEVVGCERLHGKDARLLAVTLRPFYGR